MTPLHIACKYRNLAIVEYLVNRKNIRVNEQTLYKKMTALHYAVEKGFIDIVRVLLTKKEINKNLRNSNGKTAWKFTNNNEILELFR